jgi:hypothetical protein
MVSAGVVVAAAAVAALAVFCGTDPLRLGSMVDFPGFEAHLVELPDAAEMPPHADTAERLRGAEIRFRGEVQGPESVAFDPRGRGPYTGVADGRVLFWDGARWAYFAHASPNWTAERCGPKTSHMEYLKDEHVCGRALGIRFDRRTGDLYIADAYYGLFKVGPEGGLATPLATEAEGVPFNFTNDLDLDADGNVYFTDSSIHYQRRSVMPSSAFSSPLFLQFHLIGLVAPAHIYAVSVASLLTNLSTLSTELLTEIIRTCNWKDSLC